MRHLYLLLLIFLFGCGPDEFIPSFQVESAVGMKPVYADSTNQNISLDAPRAIEQAGKIYSYGDLLIVGEREEGIHILDNSDPRNPENLLFVTIPGNNDFAVKDGIVYADSYFDLLALQISMDTVIVTKRLNLLGVDDPSAYDLSADYPPVHDIYFECVDPSRGEIIGWVSTMIDNPQCYRP